jgi:hypothetical protein
MKSGRTRKGGGQENRMPLDRIYVWNIYFNNLFKSEIAYFEFPIESAGRRVTDSGSLF